MTAREIARLLTTTTPDLSARLREVSVTWPENPKISGRFFYISFRDSLPTTDDLINVAHARMVNFALPASRIQEAAEQLRTNPSTLDPWVRLVTEARDLFIKTYEETNRSGELGELLLYMLLEWALNAPIVACKMYLKTSLQMPVHGTDGIHLGCDGEHLVMYWGESKMHAKLSTALTDIATSIHEQHSSASKRSNEIRIVRANLNIDSIGLEAREALLRYFNPYQEESNQLRECFACLAGFDSALYKAVKDERATVCEQAFKELYQERISSAYDLVKDKITAAQLDHLRFVYFLLPFSSVDDARKKFQNRLWGRE